MICNPNKCSACKKIPETMNLAGLYYIQCRQCGQIEVNPVYEKVVRNWNDANKSKEKHTISKYRKFHKRCK